MSDFRMIRGFEEVWRAPVGARTFADAVLSRPSAQARLRRIVARTPEVVVRVTGRTHDVRRLRAHLDYLTRRGKLEADGPAGAALSGREAMKETAEDWALQAELDPRRISTTPMSLSLMLSMPPGTDALKLRDAARAFAEGLFAEAHDYRLVLHTDTAHPHVHIAVQAVGRTGRRLNPTNAELEAWRQRFARELRDRGVPAEATPRRARGVTRKSEPIEVRKMRERAQAGRGPMPRVLAEAYRQAAQAAFLDDAAPRPWERRLVERQARVRALYLAQARLLQVSSEAEERKLGDEVEAFLLGMPAPESRRLALARELRSLRERRADRKSRDEPAARER